jgi:acylphosphatase
VSERAGHTRVRVWIQGRVQGVGFRYSICDMAERLGLGGWVRNVSDGSVEAVFEGPADEVAMAVAWCQHGPPGAWVSDLRTGPEPLAGESSFHARPTAFLGERP